jgi:hypothetical protein
LLRSTRIPEEFCAVPGKRTDMGRRFVITGLDPVIHLPGKTLVAEEDGYAGQARV